VRLSLKKWDKGGEGRGGGHSPPGIVPRKPRGVISGRSAEKDKITTHCFASQLLHAFHMM